MEPLSKIATATLIKHGVLAFFGAIVHASGAHRKGESKGLLDFMLLVIMSSFSGVIFALVGLATFGEDSYYTLALAGTGGFLGVEGMTIIIEKLRLLLVTKK